MSSPTESKEVHGHVCPWWLAYTFDNPLRKLVHRPQKILAPYVKAGTTAMDVGCGMGFFSIGMAKMVGDCGQVFSVDLQQQMLNITHKRAKRAGVDHRIRLHRCESDRIGISQPIDFILAFWMAHEAPDMTDFFEQLRSCLHPTGKVLVAEPKMHVSEQMFADTVEKAQGVGLGLAEKPNIRFSRTAVLNPV